MRTSTHLVTLLFAGGALLPAGLSAQDPPAGVLEGQVLDSLTGRPVAEVLIRLDSGPETLSDAEGRFRLEGLAPGEHDVAFLTADCRITWSRIDMASGGISRVEVRLAAPLGEQAEEEREAAERRRSQGTLVTAAEIEAMHALTLLDVIRRVEPNMAGRRRNSVRDTLPDFVVVIDGVRAMNSDGPLESVRPSDVETLELLPGPSGGWEFGSDGSAGVIRITTRRGGTTVGGRAGEGPGGCVVPGFPGG